MKAQEYFNKYFDREFDTSKELEEVCGQVLKDFAGEVTALVEKRGVKTDAGAVGVIKELNTKWNSLACKVAEKFGGQVLCRNAIWNIFLADRFPKEFEHRPN